MKSGGFALEQVLRFRSELEKLSKLEYALARQQLESAEEALRSEEINRDLLAGEFAAKQQDGISSVELQIYASFFEKKNNDIRRQRSEVGRLNQAMTEKREALLEASKEKKVLETLKEKQLRERQRLVAEKERAFLDEIAISRDRGGEP